MAIIEGLENQLQWPDVQRRRAMVNSNQGEIIFRSCIGIADVNEYQIVKPKDPRKEQKTWSGKVMISYGSFGTFHFCKSMFS